MKNLNRVAREILRGSTTPEKEAKKIGSSVNVFLDSISRAMENEKHDSKLKKDWRKYVNKAGF